MIDVFSIIIACRHPSFDPTGTTVQSIVLYYSTAEVTDDDDVNTKNTS